MIPVLMNGSVIYKLCFARRRYSTIKRKNVSAERIIKAIDDIAGGARNQSISKDEAKTAVRAVFTGKPLYETTVLVYIADRRKDDPPIATATVRQNPTDAHSPEQGRQMAIEKLLNTNPKLFGGAKSIFTKPERTAIRKAYESRPRGKKADTPTPAPAPQGGAPAKVGVRPVSQRPAARLPVSQQLAANVHRVTSKVVSMGRPWVARDNGAVH